MQTMNTKPSVATREGANSCLTQIDSLDGEFGSVGYVGGTFIVIVFVVKIASNLEPRTLLGRHPEVGRAGVRDNGELLLGTTNADLDVVLGVLVALHGSVLASELETTEGLRPLLLNLLQRNVNQSKGRCHKQGDESDSEHSLHIVQPSERNES